MIKDDNTNIRQLLEDIVERDESISFGIQVAKTLMDEYNSLFVSMGSMLLIQEFRKSIKNKGCPKMDNTRFYLRELEPGTSPFTHIIDMINTTDEIEYLMLSIPVTNDSTDDAKETMKHISEAIHEGVKEVLGEEFVSPLAKKKRSEDKKASYVDIEEMSQFPYIKTDFDI